MERITDEQTSFTSVNEQLRQMTAIYLDSHPALTLNALAIRAGVAATTMRRLMRGEDKGELAPHSVLALVSYLLREKKISTLLTIIEGPVAELLKRSFDQFIFDEKATHQLDQSLNEIFKDKTNYLIYKLAANKCGTTIEEIKNCFGLHGLKKCHELIKNNWIISDKFERLHAKEKNFSTDLALAHQLTHSLVDLYKPDDVASGLNLFYSLSEGMNEEGIKKIKEIEKEAVKKVFEVMNEEQFQGFIPYFSVFLSDVLGPTPIDSSNTNGVLQ
jgi:hypothetical protein